MKGLGLQALEPPKHVTRPVVPKGPTMAERELTAVAVELKKQENAQVKWAPAGMLGVVLLSITGYLIWGKR